METTSTPVELTQAPLTNGNVVSAGDIVGDGKRRLRVKGAEVQTITDYDEWDDTTETWKVTVLVGTEVVWRLGRWETRGKGSMRCEDVVTHRRAA